MVCYFFLILSSSISFSLFYWSHFSFQCNPQIKKFSHSLIYFFFWFSPFFLLITLFFILDFFVLIFFLISFFNDKFARYYASPFFYVWYFRFNDSGYEFEKFMWVNIFLFVFFISRLTLVYIYFFKLLLWFFFCFFLLSYPDHMTQVMSFTS